MINGGAHVALYTDRFEETIEFYQNAFDAKELGRFSTDKRGCWLQMGTSILELFEIEESLGTGTFKHIALSCDCVDESYEKALKAGAKAYVEPKDICLELEEKQELRIAFVKGINEEEIELCEKRIVSR